MHSLKLSGKPDAGNPPVRFDEGGGGSRAAPPLLHWTRFSRLPPVSCNLSPPSASTAPTICAICKICGSPVAALPPDPFLRFRVLRGCCRGQLPSASFAAWRLCVSLCNLHLSSPSATLTASQGPRASC